MALEIYLTFNGKCREAVDYYVNAFGVEKQQIMTFGEAPGFDAPEQAKDLIMHTFIVVDGTKIMMSDNFPGQPFHLGNNISLSVSYKDQEKVRDVFNQLKVGGKVDMDLNETFFSPLYGLVTDKYGIQWNVLLSKE